MRKHLPPDGRADTRPDLLRAQLRIHSRELSVRREGAPAPPDGTVRLPRRGRLAMRQLVMHAEQPESERVAFGRIEYQIKRLIGFLPAIADERL